ncbi:MAG: AI-2E family transporter [Methanofollis sp.]|uniref:AI-2E family transporter n=1 Tax=Methanofollis sp. TaxID=2052835 RepID=UPI0026181B41|nr:AI-2E family transporter [Methanofollis sp.]MDD4255150.1 AI-2E family transporter [Methanofollis sp.]
MSAGIIWSPAGTALICGAAFVIVAAGMHAGADFLNPILFAFLIAALTAPLQQRLMKKGMPRGAAIPAVIGLIVLFCAFILGVISISLVQMGEALPAYQEMLEVQIERVMSFFPGTGISPGDIPAIPGDSPFRPSIVSVLAGLAGLLAEFFLVLLITAFLLPAGGEGPVFRRYSDVVVGHFTARGRAALATGAGTGLFLAVIGVDFPLLWGLVVFILSFIPFIGIWIAAVPPIGMAWLEYGTGGAGAVVAGIAAINILAERGFATPEAAKVPGLSPAVTIVSLFFWTWVLGIPGMFLAVPLTLAAKTLLESSEDTCGLARLMETKSVE